MKKSINYLLLILLSVFSYLPNLQAQLDKSLLWEISGNGLKEKSYIYGTIHIIPSTDYFLHEGTKKAFDQCKSLVLELDMDEMSDMGNMMSIFDKLMMPDGQSLKTLLNEQDYKKISDHFEKLGLPMMMFEKMKPMLLTTFVSPDMNPMNMMNGNMKSYEMEFTEMAKEKNMPRTGLETIEFQISIFDSIPYKVQADMLMQSINEESKSDIEMQKLYDLYKQQDLDGLNTTINNDASMNPYLNLMLTNRNKSWIENMAKKMEENPCFFAVGAGHLAGQEGVINLLKKKGYSLKPISK